MAHGKEWPFLQPWPCLLIWALKQNGWFRSLTRSFMNTQKFPTFFCLVNICPFFSFVLIFFSLSSCFLPTICPFSLSRFFYICMYPSLFLLLQCKSFSLYITEDSLFIRVTRRWTGYRIAAEAQVDHCSSATSDCCSSCSTFLWDIGGCSFIRRPLGRWSLQLQWCFSDMVPRLHLKVTFFNFSSFTFSLALLK